MLTRLRIAALLAAGSLAAEALLWRGSHLAALYTAARRRLLASRSLARTVRVAAGRCEHARARSAEMRNLICCAFPEFIGQLVAGDDIVDVQLGCYEPEQSHWLLCEDAGGRLVGMALLIELHDSLFVASLAVDASLRGRGIGSHLMRTSSAYAASLGLPKVSGNVSTEAPHLARLYTRLGGTMHPPMPSSAGSSAAAPPTRRWDSPSGPVTALDTPAPRVLPPLEAADD